MSYLYAAYAVTWIIHLTYLVVLALRYARVRKEMDELKGK